MSKVSLYTKIGTKSEVSIPEIFKGKVNSSLLAQAIHVYRDNLHQGTSRVKTRGEVDLVKAKVYKQKGTGNARHGAKSAPIFVGGGAAHGPKGIKSFLALPKKMRQKALSSALSFKANKGHVLLADLSGYSKSKEASALVEAVKKNEETKNAKLTFVFSDKNKESKKVFFNLNKVDSADYRNLNAYKVYFGGRLVFDKDIFEVKKTTKAK